MNKQIDIITAKGDKLKVSLSSSYEAFVKEIIEATHTPVDIVDISIEGLPSECVSINDLGKIADIIGNSAMGEPDVIFFYFCDLI